MPPQDAQLAIDLDLTRTADGAAPVVGSHAETRDQQFARRGEASTGRTESTPTPEQFTLPPKYSFVRELGRGGMGEVVHAFDTELQRHVAIKFMRGKAKASVFARRRFQDEARILAQLQHPNVVDVFERGEFDGEPYFVMAYLDGHSLANRLSEFRTSAGRAVGVVAVVAGGVQHAHEHGVFHRDLKASNVMFDAGRPVVVDFGCARWDDAELSTQGFALLGTLSHMAPEVFERGSKEHDARADLWSLGVMLYHLLAGELPFAFDPLTAEGRARLQTEDPRPVRSHPGCTPGVDDRLEGIIGRALSKNPNDRYQTAAEFAAELDEWLGTAVEPPPVVPTPSESAPLPPAKRGSRRWVAVGGAVGLLLVAGAFASAFWPKTDAYTPPTSPVVVKATLAERLTKPGDFVTFIGDVGLPVEQVGTLRGFEGVGSVQLGVNNVCTLSAAHQYFHEVFNEPLPFPVRWEVDVALGTRDQPTRAGLYAIEKSHAWPEGNAFHLGYINDFGAGERHPQNRRELLNHYVAAAPARFLPYDGGPRANAMTMLTPFTVQYPKRVGPPDPQDSYDRPVTFHRLVIDVWPDRVTAERDGNAADCPPFDLKKDLWMIEKPFALAEGVKLTRPVFGHGFGIYVRNGAAAFQNLRLTRLAE